MADSDRISMIDRVLIPAEHSLRTLPEHGGLEAKLMAADTQWQTHFCGIDAAEHPPTGAPALLIISASAVKANELLKQLPTFRQVRLLFCMHHTCASLPQLLERRIQVCNST